MALRLEYWDVGYELIRPQRMIKLNMGIVYESVVAAY